MTLSLSAFSLLSPSRLLSSLSFPHSALNGEFRVVILWVNPCGGRGFCVDLCMGCGFCVNPFGCGDDGVGLGKCFG